MTAPAQVLAAVRSIPHPRQESHMPAVDKTTASDAEFQARIDRFDAAPPAPESFDAVAALRRVEALADELGRVPHIVDPLVTRVGVARRIRAAIAAPH